MIRGNHECRQLTAFFNFKQECEVKYDNEIYLRIMESFDALPLMCLINGRFIGVHGGISPGIKDINEVSQLNRFQEPPKDGVICDLLWSDPCENDLKAPGVDWEANGTRGCSYVFGGKAAATFLAKNSLISIIRAHEAQLEGLEFLISQV